MPIIEPMDLLVCVEKKEKEYDWIGAGEFYEDILRRSLKQQDFLRAGEAAERIGYCLQRGAMQAKSRAEFEKRIKLAIGTYRRAQHIYESSSHQAKAGRELRSMAVANYLSYWLAPRGVEKRKLLDECIELESKALAQFELDGNMLEYCKTYNALWLVFYLRGFLEWDRHALLRLIRRGTEWGKKTVSALSEVDNPKEVAWAYFVLASCQSFMSSLDAIGLCVAETEEAERNRTKVVATLEKSLSLSEKLDDSFLTGLGHLWLGYNMGRRSSSRSHYQKALNMGLIARDNFLTGASLESMADVIYWQSLQDPSEGLKSIEIAKKVYDKSQQHKSITRYIGHAGGEFASPHGSSTYYREKAISWTSNPQEKQHLLKTSEEAATKALRVARNSDMPRAIAGSSHSLSWSLAELAKLELDSKKKKELLKKAIAHRERFIKTLQQTEPFHHLGIGVGLSHLAENEARLAEVESNPQVKERLLKEAVSNSEKSLELCTKTVLYSEKIGDFDHLPALNRMIDRFEVTLKDLHGLTKESDILRRIIELLDSSVQLANKQGIFGLEAISCWKMANAQDNLGEHCEAAESFRRASEGYLEAANRIPQLKDFYEKHAIYMQAWTEIEKGKAAHARKEHGLAKTCYEKASGLHELTPQWSYLSPNYLALAKLETAEEFSRAEKTEEAKKAFGEAASLFEKAAKSIEAKGLESLDIRERKLATALLKASENRRRYCLGRVALEEAKIQDQNGDHLQSSRKYSEAAKILGGILEEEDRYRMELLPISYLCQAWSRMMMAEETASSIAYEEAAELFNQAKEHSSERETRLIALANSSFCKALAFATQFEATRNLKAYSEAKKHMEAARNHYAKANQKLASEYIRATLELMDAYMYMTRAETEIEPTDKAKYYSLAEAALKSSRDSYLQARHTEKSTEAQKLLEGISGRKQLAISLTSVLNDPAITATTKSFSAPTPTHEEAVGFERFEHAELEANLAVTDEATVNEQIEVKLDIVNVGRQKALLLRVRDLVPPSFTLISPPSELDNEGDMINMKGKRLEPFSIHSMQLLIQTPESGIFHLKPQIDYVDDIGHFKQCLVKPITLTIHPKLKLEFRTDAARKVFEYLTKSFAEDYMRRKLDLGKSGWRSLVQIMNNTKVSSRKIYGSKGVPGRTVSELEKRGLIEKRTFIGERGRGGKIVRIRICYERELVKRLIDHEIAKNE